MTSSEADVPCEHFQLWQCCWSKLPETMLSSNSGLVKSIIEADSARFKSSNVVWLSSTESWNPDLENLKKIYVKAHRSEEFFLTVGKSQWLRTMVKFPKNSVEEASIQSNVLPCGRYWTDETSRSMQIPCSILDEALREGKQLMIKWREWKARREGCDIGKHEDEVGKINLSSPLKKFWEIPPNDPDLEEGFKVLSSDSMVSEITWRGGSFIRKNLDSQVEFGIEFSAAQRLCHPHIVYVFGSYQEDADAKYSLYMERMQSDLYLVILDIVRPKRNHTSPPFSYHDSIDILLQIAKAMAHMHENELIHGDLKSPNVLISRLEISEGQHRYLAKVADFGKTQVKNSEKPSEPSRGTTLWVAPEVIEFHEYRRPECKEQREKIGDISVKWPEKADIYGFGIIAFEVLTGKGPYCGMSPPAVKNGVIDGSLKLDMALPLREICQKYNCPKYIMNLIPLIESCWCKAPQARPSFSEIVKELVMVRSQVLDAAASTSNGPPPTLSIQVNNTSFSPPRRQEAAASTSSSPPPTSSSEENDTSFSPRRGQEAAPPSNGHHSTGPRMVSSRGRGLLWKLLPSCVTGTRGRWPS